MENKKASETLENGFDIPKNIQSENPCGKILEEAEFDVKLGNLLENPQIDVNSKVGYVAFHGEVVDGNLEESLMPHDVAGNNQMSRWSSDDYPDGKLYANCDTPRNDDSSVLQEDLNFSWNDEIWDGKFEESVNNRNGGLPSHFPVGMENVEECIENVNDSFQCLETGSPRKVEISRNGIDILAEVFGPLDWLYDSDNIVSNSGEQSERENFSDQENENPSHAVENVTMEKEEERDNVGEQEFKFDVGDLVWVKTQTQLWWPGVISDDRNKAKDSTENVKNNVFLVKHIGNGNEVWSPSPNMKPFVEYFEEMSGQNKSRSFRGSLERALCEVGWRVKSKMTCSCFSNKSSNIPVQIEERKSLSWDRTSKSDVFSLSRFEPASFVASIRNLACSISVSGKIELLCLKNSLSAFYRSIGHCELPLQLLRPSIEQDVPNRSSAQKLDEGHNSDLNNQKRKNKRNSDAKDRILDDEMTFSGRGSESRERKKSKYLSFPYVDTKQGPNTASTSGQETEDLKHVSGLSSKSTNNSVTNSRKKGTRKPVNMHHMMSKADDIDACSAELISELRSSAADCFYLRRSKYSDSLQRFYCSFRIFAFLDGVTVDKLTGGEPVSNDNNEKKNGNNNKRLLKNSPEVPNGSMGLPKASEDQVKENVFNAASTQNQDGKGHVVRKRRPRKDRVMSSVVEPPSLALDIKSCAIDVQPTCSKVPKNHRIPGLPQVETLDKQDSDRNRPNPSLEHIPIRGPSLMRHCFELPETNKEGFVPASVNGVEQMKTFAYGPSLKDVVALPQVNSVEQMTAFVSGPSLKASEDLIKENVFSATSIKNQDGKGHVVRKRRPRKKERVISSVVEPTSNSFGLASDIKSCVIGVQPTCSKVPENHRIPELPQVETLDKQDSYGSRPNPSLEHIPVRGPSLIRHSVELLPETNKEGFVPVSVNGVEQMKTFAYGPALNDVVALPQVNNVEQMKAFVSGPSLKASEDLVNDNVFSAASIIKNQDGKGHVVRKRRARKKEIVTSIVVQPTSNSLGLASDIKSRVISFQPTCSKMPENHMIPGLPLVEALHKQDSNGNHPNFSFEHILDKGPPLVPHCVEPLPETKKEGFIPASVNGVEPKKALAHGPSLKDVQVAPPQVNNIEQMKAFVNGPSPDHTHLAFHTGLNNGVGVESNSNIVNNGPNSSFLQTGLLSFTGQPQKRGRRRKTCEGAPVILDVNGNAVGTSSAEATLPDGNHLSPEGQPQIKRRRRSKSADTELSPDGKINRVVNNKEDTGGSLLLSFAPVSPLPSKETLVAIFSRFGLLKESEIQVLEDSTAKIVYDRSSDAGFAFRSLEKSNPFGASLIGFKLVGVPVPTIVKKKNKLMSSSPYAPVDAGKNPAKVGEAPDLAILGQKMEMMKHMLEKAGDSISPEMRAKLENEIKAFLDKINSMTTKVL